MKLVSLFKKFSLIFLVLFMIGCSTSDGSSSAVNTSTSDGSSSAANTSEKKFIVLATTPMLGEFVKQVAKDNIDVRVLMPYGVDPHHFEPSPQDVKKIDEADLVFYVGLKYEPTALNKLLHNASNSKQVLVEIGPQVNPIEFGHDDHDDHDEHDDDKDKHDHDDEDEHDDDKDKHDHDDEDEDDEDEHDEDKHEGHDHGTYDPHFWFDPNRVALAVDAIKEELIKLDPENKNAYEEAANNYLEKLKALDQEIAALIESIPSDNRGIVTTHESLGYLEDRYGLEVIATVIPSLTTEDGVTPKGLVEVIEEIKEHGIKVIFIESESPTQSAEIVAKEANAKLVSGLWVETLKENQSYIDFLKTNVSLIVENLKEQ
ncbi:MAG: metal ABC transporter substrate-binding protein [SAR202 cluster bacterium]|nr:metal ABC transporter substrate-binding protein [SAR202 cluster bacterium]